MVVVIHGTRKKGLVINKNSKSARLADCLQFDVRRRVKVILTRRNWKRIQGWHGFGESHASTIYSLAVGVKRRMCVTCSHLERHTRVDGNRGNEQKWFESRRGLGGLSRIDGEAMLALFVEA